MGNEGYDMRKIGVLGCVFLLSMVFGSGVCFGSDPVEGFWMSIDEKTGKATGGWEIYVVGDKLFGKVLSIADQPQDAKAVKCKESYRDFPVPGKVNEMTVVGTPWLYNLTMERPGVWRGGQVLDAGTGHVYKCKITFRPQDGKRFLADTLEMRGEIGLGIGRSQYWRKSTREEASSLR